MNIEKITAALDAEFESMDLGRITARGYLKALLRALMEEGESFSGKRPFGNSGWQHELAAPLIHAEAIMGEIDEDGYAHPSSEVEYQIALLAMVDAL